MKDILSRAATFVYTGTIDARAFYVKVLNRTSFSVSYVAAGKCRNYDIETITRKIISDSVFI